MASFATPPNPVRRGILTPSLSPPEQNSSDLTTLLKLHEMGIITKEDLRQRVLAYSPPAAPVSTPTVQTAQSTGSPTKRKRETKTNSKRFNKKQKTIKRRPGKPVHKVAEMRKLVRDPTRQRFFAQCQSRTSVLWQPSPAGTEMMCKLLFDRACLDPIDEVYRRNPGKTHGVDVDFIKTQVYWQVYKDRSNWLGKTPVRNLMFGEPMPFDWQREFQALKNVKPAVKKEPEQAQPPSIKKELEPVQQLSRKLEPVQQLSRKLEPVQQLTRKLEPIQQLTRKLQTHASTSYDLDYIKPCYNKECGLSVWIGDEDKVPGRMLIACPRGSDWGSVKAEPYCATCWEKENELLDGMSGNYKAVGAKTAETKEKEKAAKAAAKAAAHAKKKADTEKRRADRAAKAAKRRAKKQAKTPKSKTEKKITLGGVQGPMVHPVSTGNADDASRFQTGQSVNAKFSNNKFYGAFVCKVNDDGTYNLYFPEEYQKQPVLFNVLEKHIKKPLECTGSKRYKTWHQYVGKTFYDPGTKDDPEEEDFEGGEFTVSAVVNGQLFECTRVDEPDCVEKFDIGYTLTRIRIYEEE